MKRGRPPRGRGGVGVQPPTSALDSAFSTGFSSEDDEDALRTRPRPSHHAGGSLRRAAGAAESRAQKGARSCEEGNESSPREEKGQKEAEEEGPQAQGKAPGSRSCPSCTGSCPVCRALPCSGGGVSSGVRGEIPQQHEDACKRRWCSAQPDPITFQGGDQAGDSSPGPRADAHCRGSNSPREGAGEHGLVGCAADSKSPGVHPEYSRMAVGRTGQTTPSSAGRGADADSLKSERGRLKSSGFCEGDGCAPREGSDPRSSRCIGKDGSGRLRAPDAVPEDPLDAFMNNIDQDVGLRKSKAPPHRFAGGLDSDDFGDDRKGGTCARDATQAIASISESELSTSLKSASTARLRCDNDDDVFGPELHSGNDLVLQDVDHASMNYPDIVKDVYVALPRLSTVARDAVRASFQQYGIQELGSGSHRLLAPLSAFQDLALTLPKALLGDLLARYAQPTAIQRCVIPILLSGSDVIAVAKTGSGKTVAYGIPLLVHVSSQNRRGVGLRGSGPTAIVLAPTRELAVQVGSVLRGFGKSINMGVVSVVGGAAKYEQFKQLRDGGACVVVCTPGRFIDMIRMKACSLASVSFVAVDEADRMFGMGFGPQLHQVLNHVRPDAQKVFVSATFPREVELLASDYLSDAVRLFCTGRVSAEDLHSGRTVMDVKQTDQQTLSLGLPMPMVSDMVQELYVAVDSEESRLSWLVGHLPGILIRGLVIIFCSTRGGTAELANKLRAEGYPTACIHGETDAADRSGQMTLFRKGELQILVATDVAARGLDIEGVRTVVNYEPAKNWDEHVHRSGRTGRADVEGTAFTLLLSSCARDVTFARSACAALRSANANVPAPLIDVLGKSSSLIGGQEKSRRGVTRNRGFRSKARRSNHR